MTNDTIFLDIHPSSIVIPAEQFRIINLIHTLDHIACFDDNMRSTPFKMSYKFDNNMEKQLNLWLTDLNLFCKSEHKQGNVSDADIDLIFKLLIVDDKDEHNVVFQRELKFMNGTREKALKCSVSVIGNILNGVIPFKDLSVGYLGKWSRKPKSYYNFNFLSKILAKQTHAYFKCNVLDV